MTNTNDVNQSEDETSALLVGDGIENQLCPSCGGCGVIHIPITVAGCCGNPLRSGECCGNAVPVQDWDYQACECQWKGNRSNHEHI
jgi:hypothetical protein